MPLIQYLFGSVFGKVLMVALLAFNDLYKDTMTEIVKRVVLRD